MHNKPNRQSLQSLRTTAEALLARTPDLAVPVRPADELLYELRVHQIELEMQNEELRQAQLVLKESHDRYVDLYEFAPIGYLTLTDAGMIAEANLTGTALIGVERSKLLHRCFQFFVTAEDRERWHRFYAGVKQHSENTELELEMQRGDASTFHAHIDCRLTRAGEAPPMVRITLTDIPERKLALQAVQLSEAKFKAIFEYANDAIFIMTEDTFVDCNQKTEQMFRCKRTEILNRKPYEFSPPFQPDMKNSKECLLEKIAAALSGVPQFFEWQHRKFDGALFDAEVSINRIEVGGKIMLQTIVRDITERKQAEKEIRNLAFYDALTKLPNRRLFLDRFRTALPVSARHNSYGALLFLDLDKFKPLNDTYGHECGDLMLIEVATRIKSCVREIDTAARLGGDEFVVLIEDISADQEDASHRVGVVAEKIREALVRPYLLNGHEHHSSPSIGVCLYLGNQQPVNVLLKHADMAMYKAKNVGGNTVRFFDTVMQHNVALRAEMLGDLHLAIEQRQFQLHFQIQVDNENHPVGAEALLRWIHPHRGVVLPDEFLQIAEENALILDIDDWVLETACKQLALWSNIPKLCNLTLAINISAKQFILPDFVGKIAAALRTYRINPARLKLELTESMVLDDLIGAVKKMHALKALGVCLSMDDFGTRYSSLSYLKQLPIDQLKIDHSFVQAITRQGDDALLVGNIIDLANDFCLNVIAEGVETEAQLGLLKDRDCIAYQGFLFSKAVPLEEFEELMSLLPEQLPKLS